MSIYSVGLIAASSRFGPRAVTFSGGCILSLIYGIVAAGLIVT